MVEQVTQALLLWLAVLSPDPVPIEIWSQPQNLPSVYIIPQKELANVVCGCECTLGGVYFGGDRRVIVLGGDVDGNLLTDPLSNSIHLHELEHYFQDLRFTVLNKDIQTRKENEHDAYTIQNMYLVMNNFFPININNLIDTSTNITYGRSECLGSSISALHNQNKIRDILQATVFNYESNRLLYEFYNLRLSAF